MQTDLYNIESRYCSNGKTYIMEMTPRAGGNRLAEVVKMVSGQDMITPYIKACVDMPYEEPINPTFDECYAEYIIHSNKQGILKSIEIDSGFGRDHIIDAQIWVRRGQEIQKFSSGSDALGSVVLRFKHIEEAERAVTHPEKWLRMEVF